MPVPNYPRYLCRAIERSIITISVRYADIHVRPCAISGGKYLVELRIATYLCRWKRTQSQRMPCPAMNYFWLWITFFAESWTFLNNVLLGKLRWQIIATIAERQSALPWRLWPYLPHTYPIAQEWADSLWFDPIRSNNWRTTLKVCAWNSQPDELSIANPIGVRVCPPTFTLTPVLIFKHDACGSYWPTNIINRIADKIEHIGGNLCGFGILKKFCYLYVTIDGRAYRKRHVHLYIPGLERCFPNGCHAGHSSDNE